MFLFAAGQDTSAKLLGNAMRRIADTPALQQQLRGNPGLIPSFLEEVLRLEGSTKATFRLARRKTRIGEFEVPAGKRVVVALAAANRDPRRWDEPQEFRFDRPPALGHRWRARRSGSSWSTSCSTPPRSACPRKSMASPAIAASTTSRASSFADWRICTSSLPGNDGR